jgi:hypothetical protein
MACTTEKTQGHDRSRTARKYRDRGWSKNFMRICNDATGIDVPDINKIKSYKIEKKKVSNVLYKRRKKKRKKEEKNHYESEEKLTSDSLIRTSISGSLMKFF